MSGPSAHSSDITNINFCEASVFQAYIASLLYEHVCSHFRGIYHETLELI